MNSNNNLENSLKNKNHSSKEIEISESISVDDFIRELEAKERDLHISSDLVIEIEEPGFADGEIDQILEETLPSRPAKPVTAHPAKSNAATDKMVVELKMEVSLLQSLVAKMEAERAEASENSRRRQKDFDNYKNRTERERSETFANQISNLATQMLPVLDNLNRALDFAATGANEKAQDFQQFFQGIVLVNQQVNEVLAGMGVAPIASIGERFDPHRHEAVAVEESDVYPPQTVSAELLRGYRLGDRVIRPSMVKVAAAKTRADSAAKPGDISDFFDGNE
jgi:molecular chaperone GrpE